MAESTTTGSSATNVTATSSNAPKAKQFIKPSAYDDELETDALRGSEQVMKDAGVEDKEEARREVYKEKKSA